MTVLWESTDFMWSKSAKRRTLLTTCNEIDLQLTTGDKILGVYIDENFQWNSHFQYVCKKVSSYIWLLSRIKSYLSLEHRSLFYKAYIQPHIIWGNSTNYNVSRLTKLQRRACKIILENECEDLDSAQKRVNILSFDQNVFVNKAKTMYKVANSLLPQYIIDFFQLRADSLPETALRSVTDHNFTIPKPKSNLYKESLANSGPVIWNTIPPEIKRSLTIGWLDRLLVNYSVGYNLRVLDINSVKYTCISSSPFHIKQFTVNIILAFYFKLPCFLCISDIYRTI